MRVPFDPRKQMTDNHQGGVMEHLRVLRVPRDPRDPALEPAVVQRLETLRASLSSISAVRVSWDRVGQRATNAAQLHVDDVAHARLFDEMTGQKQNPQMLGLRLRAEDTPRQPPHPAWEPAVVLQHTKLKEDVATLNDLRLSWSRATVEIHDEKAKAIADVAHARRFDDLKNEGRGGQVTNKENQPDLNMGLRLRAEDAARRPTSPSLEPAIALRHAELRRAATRLEDLGKTWALVTEDRLAARDFEVENVAHARRYDELASGKEMVTRAEREERVAGAALAKRYVAESSAFRERNAEVWGGTVDVQKRKMLGENLTHEELTNFVESVHHARDMALAREDKVLAGRMWARLCAASEIICERLEHKDRQHQISLF